MNDRDIILNELRKEKKNVNMLTKKYNTTLAWLRNVNKGNTFCSMLERYGFKDVIIYGIDDLGMRLIESCIHESVKIAAISDRRIESGGYEFDGIPMIPIRDICEYQSEETGIIVAAVGYFEEIEKDLKAMGLYNIISLRRLIG